VASGFIRKLLGKKDAPPAHLAGPLADLERVAKQRPSLQGPCELLAEVLPVLFTEPAVEVAPPLSVDAAGAQLGSGVPLARAFPVTLDRPSLRRRWLGVCEAAAKNQSGETARALASAFDALDAAALLGEVLAGRPEAVAARADALGLDAALAGTVLRLTALPALARVAAAWAGVRTAFHWDRGFCPTCGGYPLLAEFRGLDQTRVLRCGLCATGWDFLRLRCPYCDNSDHNTLGYFHVEGEENRYRAATCDQCRGYVKTLSSLAALSPAELLVADVATLHLDLAAAERGFGV
jgi:FdhE protein